MQAQLQSFINCTQVTQIDVHQIHNILTSSGIQSIEHTCLAALSNFPYATFGTAKTLWYRSFTLLPPLLKLSRWLLYGVEKSSELILCTCSSEHLFPLLSSTIPIQIHSPITFLWRRKLPRAYSSAHSSEYLYPLLRCTVPIQIQSPTATGTLPIKSKLVTSLSVNCKLSVKVGTLIPCACI